MCVCPCIHVCMRVCMCVRARVSSLNWLANASKYVCTVYARTLVHRVRARLAHHIRIRTAHPSPNAAIRRRAPGAVGFAALSPRLGQPRAASPRIVSGAARAEKVVSMCGPFATC